MSSSHNVYKSRCNDVTLGIATRPIGNCWVLYDDVKVYPQALFPRLVVLVHIQDMTERRYMRQWNRDEYMYLVKSTYKLTARLIFGNCVYIHDAKLNWERNFFSSQVKIIMFKNIYIFKCYWGIGMAHLIQGNFIQYQIG